MKREEINQDKKKHDNKSLHKRTKRIQLFASMFVCVFLFNDVYMLCKRPRQHKKKINENEIKV